MRDQLDSFGLGEAGVVGKSLDGLCLRDLS